ncbi:MAG: transporter substrate-binding domain-containing protein [Paucibacter sp.]|nr:transporter substrate-binding domain-containing protein [Roseateles sp.]
MNISTRIFLFAAATACYSVCGAATVLKLQIVERPPYLIVKPIGEFGGITVDRSMAAIRLAGIPVELERVPALRQLQRLRLNAEPVCSVGWYKTKEREQFAKFSDPVTQDSPWAAFVNVHFEVPGDGSVKSILADPHTTVLMKSGYVYGDYLDAQMAVMRAQRQETSADMPALFKMVAAGRAQIAFAPIEEIQYYLASKWLNSTDIKIVTFKEMPEGYKRYLMCSKQVDDELISRFNSALGRL